MRMAAEGESKIGTGYSDPPLPALYCTLQTLNHTKREDSHD
jgi:hypothetical protein